MLTHSSISLPLEIVGIIVQELQDHVPSLKAKRLSLVISSGCLRETSFMVCRSFHTVTRPIFFSRVELVALEHPPHKERGREPARNTCSRFHQLLQDSPGIAKLVRHLFVTDDCPKRYGGPRSTGWVIRETTLPLVLHKLSNVNLRSFGFYGGCWPWGALSRFLKGPFQALFKAPHLTSITFTGVVGFSKISTSLNLFEACSTLKHLTINEVDYGPPRRVAGNVNKMLKGPHSRIQLQSLSVNARSLPDVMEWLPTSTIFIDQLNTLSLRRLSISSHRAIQTLFASAYHSLDHLNIYRTNVDTFGQVQLNLDRLKSVRVSIKSIQTKLWEGIDVIPWLTMQLEAIVTPCAMQEITIEFESHERELDGLTPVSAAFDAAVTSPVFCELRRVSLAAFVRQTRSEEVQKEFMVNISNIFPLLHQRGLLEIQQKPHADFGLRWTGLGSSLS